MPFSSSLTPGAALPDEATFARKLRRGSLGVALGLGVPALALLVAVVYLLRSAEGIQDVDRTAAETHRVKELLVDMETGLRGYEVTENEEFLAPLKNAQAQLWPGIETLATLSASNAEQRRAVERLRQAVQEWEAFAAEAVLPERRGARGRELPFQQRGKAGMDEIRERISALLENGARERNQRAETLAVVRWSLICGLILTGGLGAPLAVAWLRRAMREIGGSYEKSLIVAEQRAVESQVTLRSIGDAVVATNAAGKVTFLNPVAERLMGWTTAEAQGRPLEDVFVILNEETGEAAVNPVDRVLRERIVVGLANHTVLRSRSGAETPIEDSAAPILGVDGEIRGVILVFHDVGDKREIERRLQEAEWRSRSALEIGGAGSWVLDLATDRVTCDEMMARTFGLPAAVCDAGAEAEVFLGAIPEKHRGSVNEALRRTIETGAPFEVEFEVQNGEGVWRWIQSRGRMQVATKGRTAQILGFLIDTTAARVAEEQVRKQVRLATLRADIASELAAEGEVDGALQKCCELLVRHLGVAFARIWTRAAEEPVLHLRASAGIYTHLDGAHGRIAMGDFKIGRIAQNQEPLFTNEVTDDPNISDPAWARREGMVAFAGCPLIGGERTVGVLGMFCREPMDSATFGELLPIADTLAVFLQRKRVERELRAQTVRAETGARAAAEGAERFRALVEAVSLQVWTAQLDGALDFANQECAEYLGSDDLARDILGHRWAQYVHPDDVPRAQERWGHSLGTGERYEVEFRLKGHDAQYRWFLVRAEVMRDAAGAMVKWLGTNTDIDALKRAQSEAERASRSKDEFLAALSHELRTPLTPVLMTAAALRGDESLPAEVREQMGMMERNIALEARLIDDLLDLTRISRGKLDVRRQPCDAHSLISLAIEIVRDDSRVKGIAIERKFAAMRSGLNVDPARFQQVIWNLLRNAVKFTPRGGTIIIRTRDEEDESGQPRLRIEVQDSGIGISADQLEKIFLPFEQGGLTGDHRFGGVGLGLAIARAIVDVHQGRIAAMSDGPKCGATFLVEFPEATLPPHGATEPVAPLLPNAGSTEATPPKGGALRLLLVEDHEPTIQVLSRLLGREGHHVVCAGSLASALAAVEVGDFDLVISDLGLPDGTGTELMEQLRDRYGLRGIALSGYGMEEDVARTRESGFITHLTKPVDFHQLARALRTID